VEPPLVQTEMTTPMTGATQPDATTSLPTGLGQSGKDTTEVSSVTVVKGQTSTSMSSVPPTTGGAVPEEVASMEGLATLGANVGSSWALVCAGQSTHMEGACSLVGRPMKSRGDALHPR
jgi:hypothetical protein